MEQFKMTLQSDTIAAISTPSGMGGIAVIRISGPEAINLIAQAWKGKDLLSVPSHSLHLGQYKATDGSILDECVVAVYRAPASFTGENVVEISTHGSRWIQREMMADLIRRGARTAMPGEFTQRAFLNGKIDLARAEGVADLIASSSRASHAMALSQTRGGFSKELERLREQLIEFASLLELELDFSEEDVEFADRLKLKNLAEQILGKIKKLSSSYSTGSVLKSGVPVVIAGAPNAGKSSLLNLILNDDKAIVSEIPGTTRDIVEDTVEIEGILYRFIDTAGLRSTDDTIETLGIQRTRDALEKAYIVIWIIDSSNNSSQSDEELNTFLNDHPEARLIILHNKSDLKQSSCPQSDSNNPTLSLSTAANPAVNPSGLISDSTVSVLPQYPTENSSETGASLNSDISADLGIIRFSTKTLEGYEELLSRLKELASDDMNPETDLIITNARHYEALIRAEESLTRAIEAIETNISGDFIAQDIRETLHHLGTITGAITTDNLLHSIFSRFCIGK